MLEGLKMEGLEEPDDRGFHAMDVEIVRRLNQRGVFSVPQLSYALNLDYYDAQDLLCPSYLMVTGSYRITPYLKLMKFLKLDIDWLEAKIGRVRRADQRVKEKWRAKKKKRIREEQTCQDDLMSPIK